MVALVRISSVDNQGELANGPLLEEGGIVLISGDPRELENLEGKLAIDPRGIAYEESFVGTYCNTLDRIQP